MRRNKQAKTSKAATVALRGWRGGALWLLVAAVLAVPVDVTAARLGGQAVRPASLRTALRKLPVEVRRRVVVERVDAPELRRSFHALVLLPRGGVQPTKTYPLLVLLHAHGSPPVAWLGSGRLHRAVDDATAAGKLPEPIVLLASGGFGYWVDWRDGKHPFGSLVVDRYLRHMRAKYPVSRNPGLVGLAGASMGGFGALSLGLRHPDKFGFVGALSATDLEIAVARHPKRRLYRRFLGPDDTQIPLLNPRHLVNRGHGTSQRFVLAYGTREGSKFRVGTQQLATAMLERDLDVRVLQVRGGGHGWNATWRSGIRFMLDHLGQVWQQELQLADDLWLM